MSARRRTRTSSKTEPDNLRIAHDVLRDPLADAAQLATDRMMYIPPAATRAQPFTMFDTVTSVSEGVLLGVPQPAPGELDELAAMLTMSDLDSFGSLFPEVQGVLDRRPVSTRAAAIAAPAASARLGTDGASAKLAERRVPHSARRPFKRAKGADGESGDPDVVAPTAFKSQANDESACADSSEAEPVKPDPQRRVQRSREAAVRYRERQKLRMVELATRVEQLEAELQAARQGSTLASQEINSKPAAAVAAQPHVVGSDAGGNAGGCAAAPTQPNPVVESPTGAGARGSASAATDATAPLAAASSDDAGAWAAAVFGAVPAQSAADRGPVSATGTAQQVAALWSALSGDRTARPPVATSLINSSAAAPASACQTDSSDLDCQRALAELRAAIDSGSPTTLARALDSFRAQSQHERHLHAVEALERLIRDTVLATDSPSVTEVFPVPQLPELFDPDAARAVRESADAFTQEALRVLTNRAAVVTKLRAALRAEPRVQADVEAHVHALRESFVDEAAAMDNLLATFWLQLTPLQEARWLLSIDSVSYCRFSVLQSVLRLAHSLRTG